MMVELFIWYTDDDKYFKLGHVIYAKIVCPSAVYLFG